MSEIEITSIVIQSSLDDWQHVKEQIDRSKIRRFPHKKILGMTLTKYITDCRRMELSSHQTLSKLLKDEGVNIFIFENPLDKDEYIKNLKISVSARYGEQSSLEDGNKTNPR